MKDKQSSTTLSTRRDKSLSGWERAIFEAKTRITELRQSIRTFQSLRDEGMEFPEPEAKPSRKRTTESTDRLLSQKRLKGQSRLSEYQLLICISAYHLRD
jgi:hypothetical protein